MLALDFILLLIILMVYRYAKYREYCGELDGLTGIMGHRLFLNYCNQIQTNSDYTEQEWKNKNGRTAQDNIAQERNAQRFLDAQNGLQIIQCQHIGAHRQKDDKIHAQAGLGDVFYVHLGISRKAKHLARHILCATRRLPLYQNSVRYQVRNRHIFRFAANSPYSTQRIERGVKIL